MNEDYTQDGLKKLNEFFSNLPSNQKFFKDKYNDASCVDLSWIYTESIPHEIIQKTICRLLQEASIENKYKQTYLQKCASKKIHLSNSDKYFEKKSIDPTQITTVTIQASPQRTSLIFHGADGWSKIRVTDKVYENERAIIPYLTFSEFEKEICKTIIQEQNPDYTPFLKGIHNLVDTSFSNLVDYYKYLQEKEQEHNTFSILVDYPESSTNQRDNPNPNPNQTNKERVSDVIPATERYKLLQDLKPKYIYNIDEQLPNGDIRPTAHISFVYDDFLADIPADTQKKGYVIITEPLSGERVTRISYVSEEQLDQLRHSTEERDTDLLHQYINTSLSTSPYEFTKNYGVLLTHTKFDSFADRIKFFLNGTKGESLSYLKDSLERLQHLYGDENISLPYYRPRISKVELANLGNAGTGRIDITAENKLKELEDPSLKQNNEGPSF